MHPPVLFWAECGLESKFNQCAIGAVAVAVSHRSCSNTVIFLTSTVELQTKVREDFTISEKAHTRPILEFMDTMLNRCKPAVSRREIETPTQGQGNRLASWSA